MRQIRAFLIIGVILSGYTVVLAQEIQQIPLWCSGEDGYHTYRIPALAVTPKGTVLAFCEGRKYSRSDTGDIDLLIKQSIDEGRTWGKHRVLWDDAGNTCGNPCPIVDHQTGIVWLLMTWNRGDDHEREIIDQKSKDTRRVFVTSSEDDGRTWAEPKEITAEVKKLDWTWYATGPGAGIQIEHGPNKGRLVVPCDHIETGTRRYYSHIVYSDDNGKTWSLGGSTPKDLVNECQVVELPQGRLMLNMRNYDRTKRNRQVAISDDGGLTWKEQHFNSVLIEPVCQASIRRYSWIADGERSVILFSNPASEKARVNMTVRASLDDGSTWPGQRVLCAGPSAYSDLAVLSNSLIACLYESGQKNPYEKITFARFGLRSLSGLQEVSLAGTFKPPVIVGVPPADAGRGLIRVSETEIRHYGGRGAKTYLVSSEPSIIELRDGRLWRLIRCAQDNHYESFSEDDGQTWTKPVPSPFYGTITMPDIGRLRDGRIIYYQSRHF